MAINPEALTLALSRRLAISDGRSTHQAIIHTARALRAATNSRDTYQSLGVLLTTTHAEREHAVELAERTFLNV